MKGVITYYYFEKPEYYGDILEDEIKKAKENYSRCKNIVEKFIDIQEYNVFFNNLKIKEIKKLYK